MISEDISLMHKGKTDKFSQSELVSSIFLPFGMSKHFSTRLLVLIFLLNRCLSIPIPSKPDPCKIDSLLNPLPDPCNINSILNPTHDAQTPSDPRIRPSSSQGHDAQPAPESSTQPGAKKKRKRDAPDQLRDKYGRKSKLN